MCMKSKKYEVLKNFDYYYSNGNKFQSFRKQDVIELFGKTINVYWKEYTDSINIVIPDDFRRFLDKNVECIKQLDQPSKLSQENMYEINKIIELINQKVQRRNKTD